MLRALFKIYKTMFNTNVTSKYSFLAVYTFSKLMRLTKYPSLEKVEELVGLS